MLHPLGFVHVHEEVLQQTLGLRQVLCIGFLVVQIQVLLFTLCVLQIRVRMLKNLNLTVFDGNVILVSFPQCFPLLKLGLL